MKRFLQIAAAIILAIVFLCFFLWNSNLADVWAILRSSNVTWILIGFAVNWFALVFRTARWRVVLSADDPPPFYPTFFANVTGYMLSTILPIRASDVARPALLSRRSKVNFSTALGTVLSERVLDFYSILLLFVSFAVLRWRQFSTDPRTSGAFIIIKAGAVGVMVALALLTALIVGIFFFRSTVRRAHEFVGRIVPARFRGSWMRFFDSFVASLDLIRKPAAFARVVLFTIGVWFCLTFQFLCALYALHRSLPFDASFFVNGITTVGLAIPTPGGVGGFHKACQIVLTKFYFFDIDSSVAVALLFHLVGTLPVLVTGLLLFVHEGLNWRQLKEETHSRNS